MSTELQFKKKKKERFLSDVRVRKHRYLIRNNSTHREKQKSEISKKMTLETKQIALEKTECNKRQILFFLFFLDKLFFREAVVRFEKNS